MFDNEDLVGAIPVNVNVRREISFSAIRPISVWMSR